VEQTQISEQDRQAITETESEVRKDGTKMPNKLMKSIRNQSLKIDWFSRAVDDYRSRMKKEREVEHLLSAIFRGGSVKL
jgi:uncharacterized protein YifE (UPF0438 family)